MTARTLSRRDFTRMAGLAGLLGLAVTGCGAGPGSDAVTWQAIPSYSLLGTDKKRVAYLRHALDDFDAHSALPISPQVTSADTVAAMTKLLLQASQGRAADIAQVDTSVFGRTAQFARPLDKPMADAGLSVHDWIPSLQPQLTAGTGTVRGLQFTTDVRVLYHRKDLVPQPPASWDELVAVAKPLARRGLQVYLPAGRSEGAVINCLWPQLWAAGYDIVDPDGRPTFAAGPARQTMTDALGVVERLVREGISPSRVSTFGSEDNANADVAAGRASMFLGGSWQAAVLNNLVSGRNFFDTWGVAPLPSLDGRRHATTAGGWVWAGFTGDDRRLDVGAAFVIDAFVGDAGMAAWCTAGGYLPPRTAVYAHPDYHKNPFTDTFRQHLAQYGHVRPAARTYLDVSNTMQIALSSVASGTSTAPAALADALDRLA
jgi:multiple sugar transport system substrate-binding protein